MGQRLALYRHGVAVGRIKVSSPQQEDNIVADLIANEAEVGDEVRVRDRGPRQDSRRRARLGNTPGSAGQKFHHKEWFHVLIHLALMQFVKVTLVPGRTVLRCKRIKRHRIHQFAVLDLKVDIPLGLVISIISPFLVNDLDQRGADRPA